MSPLKDNAARPLALLLGVTVLVLLIVCVNVANLLLARGASRTGELAIRASLGASRVRLARQLLAESFVLIAIGGLSSLLVAVAIVRLITRLLPAGLAGGLTSELSLAALVFAAGASFATVLVFGLVPSWRASGAAAAEVMKANASRSTGGRGAARFRATLTTAQIAFSMVLLVLAGLFARNLMNLARVDLGMDVDSVVTFSITPRLNAYDSDRLADLYERVEQGLAAEPGVLAVGSAWLPLLSNFSFGAPASVEGYEAEPGIETVATQHLIGPGYFDALGVPLLAGRAFTEQDRVDSQRIAIVNETFVRRLGVDDPVGKRLGLGTTAEYPLEIVGVVADAKHDSVRGPVQAMVYVPRLQSPDAIESMFYYVRAGIDPEALLAAIPRVVAEIDADVPVTNLRTMAQQLRDSANTDRLLSLLSAGFAALATVLAAIGLYGVLAYNVTQRTRELGLRLALGAEPKRLRQLVLRQVGAMALTGAGAGLVAAIGIGRFAETLLFGLSGRDPAVITGAALVLAAVVLAASWLPARRASGIAPMEALRYE